MATSETAASIRSHGLRETSTDVSSLLDEGWAQAGLGRAGPRRDLGAT